MRPSGVITSQPKPTGPTKYSVKDAELLSNSSGPPKKDVPDDANRSTAVLLADEIGDEVFESGPEGNGSFEKADDEVIRKNIAVLGIGREAMVGAVEGELKEPDGGVGGKRGAELGDVERGVNQGDVVVGGFLYMEGKGEEREDMALRHEWKQHHISPFIRHY
ncbi:hypothetical protein SLE2022_006320 [Rubroshorea leprosula]